MKKEMFTLLSNQFSHRTRICQSISLTPCSCQAHYIGCLLIVVSGMVAVTVEIQTKNPPIGAYTDSKGVQHTSSFAWTILYLVGVIPVGIGNAYEIFI